MKDSTVHWFRERRGASTTKQNHRDRIDVIAIPTEAGRTFALKKS